MSQPEACVLNTRGMPSTQCEVLDVGEYSDALLAPFDKFLVPYWVFSSFLCIQDVAHLNCHPFLRIFNHFYPFFTPILGSPHHGDPEKARVM